LFPPQPSQSVEVFKESKKNESPRQKFRAFAIFFAHFLHSFQPFFTAVVTLDTVCVEKVTSARNVFKPDLERCKRESQEAQQLCGGLGNSVGNKLGNKKLLGNKGEGEQGPTVATQQDALSPIVDALQVLLVLVSDDVDHGAGEVGV